MGSLKAVKVKAPTMKVKKVLKDKTKEDILFEFTNATKNFIPFLEA